MGGAQIPVFLMVHQECNVFHVRIELTHEFLATGDTAEILDECMQGSAFIIIHAMKHCVDAASSIGELFFNLVPLRLRHVRTAHGTCSVSAHSSATTIMQSLADSALAR